MKNLIQRFNEKLHSKGRYGIDAFSRALLIMGVIFLVLGLIPDLWFLSLYAVFPLVWALIRCFSKKIDKRESELDAYESMEERRKENAALRTRKWTDRKTHKYYRCKYCDTVFRVPKGKGKVRVTCPGCREQYTKKT